MKKQIHAAVMEDIKKYLKDFDISQYEIGYCRTDKSVVTLLRKYYDSHLPVDVTAWIRVNEPDESLKFAPRLKEQLCFVRDILSILLHSSYETYLEEPVMVIGTHVSKSVKLPVYQIISKEYGLEIILRNNFYNWKVSVKSVASLDFDTMGLFETNKVIPDVYCEGFPEDKVYGSYEQNHSQFTFEIFSEYNLYTFAFLLKHYLSKY